MFGSVVRTGLLALVGLLVVGCGSVEQRRGGNARPVLGEVAPPVTQPFPHAGGGERLTAIVGRLPQGPSLGLLTNVVQAGTNRVGFVLLDRARRFINGATVALYTARTDGRDVRGPYIAASTSLAVQRPYVSRLVADDRAIPKAMYVANPSMGAGGRRLVVGIVRLSGRLVVTVALPVTVGARDGHPPAVGQQAVRVHTPTVRSVGGDATLVDSRDPPATALDRADLATEIGHRPIVLLFATPAFCGGAVCALVEDVVDETRHQVWARRFAFVHVEAPSAAPGDPSAFAAWGLRSEPWVFIIDHEGRVRARFPGAVSPDELETAMAAVR